MRFCSLIVIALLLAAIVAIPSVSGANRTADPAYYLTHANTLAGPKDMSMDNPPIPVEPLQTMNETTARLYPNVTACGKDGCIQNRPCLFPFIPCQSALMVMVVFKVNATTPDQPGPVIGYGLSGWPLNEPILFPRSKDSGIFLPFISLAGMFA
jgi:hypothetical protein